MTRRSLPALALLVAALAAAPAAAAAQDSALAGDTTLLSHAARMARERYGQLVGPTGMMDNGTQLYRAAQADVARGQWSDAALQIQAALQRAPRSPLYRGELGFMIARTGDLDSAATLLQQAYSIQQQNPWYLVGLAVVRAAQARWPDAAGTLEVAAQTDSGIVDGRIAATAVAYFNQAGDPVRALHWARVAVQQAPDDATSWFMLARSYAEHDDTAGMPAARRYHALRPDEPFGKLILANMLFLIGQTDSAIALADQVAADSAYRDAAAVVYLRCGARLLRQREVDRAVATLTRGRALGATSVRREYAYYLGSAQLVQASTTLPAVEQSRNCNQARAAESLLVETERNLREGESVDTTRARMFLESVLPSYRTNAQNLRESFCRPPPAGRQPTPARPRPRP